MNMCRKTNKGIETVRGLWVICLILTSICVSCRAEEPLKQLSLKEAISIALNVNPSLKQVETQHQDALSRLRIASFQTYFGLGGLTNLERDPDDSGLSTRIFGNLEYENLFGTKASLTVSPFGFGSERSSLGLSIRRPLMKGKGLLSEKSNLVLGAKTDAAIQEKEAYLLRQSKVQQVIEDYYRAVLAREQIKVRERAVAVAMEVAEGARKRAEAGLVAEIEVSRAEIRVAETQNQLNLQKQAARAALDRLMVTIGQGVGQTPELTDSVPDGDAQVPQLTEAIKTALENRSELAIYDERLSDQARRLAIAKDELRPELNAVAGFNSINRDKGFISTSLYELGSLALGLEMRFPLDKRITLEQRDIASRGVDILQKMRLFQMEEIAQEVRQSYRSVESARSTVEIFSQNMKVAEERLRIAQRMVEEGLETNREVLDAQESLTQLESSLNSAKTDLYLASVNLKYAMGEDLTTIGLQ